MLDVTTSAARSSAEWELAMPLEEAHQRVLRAVAGMPRVRVRSVAEDRIELSVLGNFSSWGEVISIELTPAAGGTALRVRTRPIVPFTLLDWGEGARDIRALHAAVAYDDGGGGGAAGLAGGSTGEPSPQLGRLAPWPEPFAWFAVVTASVLLLLALVNLVLNSSHIGSSLPLLVLMPFSLVFGIRSLRASRRTDVSEHDGRRRRPGRDR
ncbi:MULTISPECIES: hypothetical protein [unclassified Curtobacterium]|uniref:hypothetical protein n=1 Tax=unclassified Curtobacterium TaxID=257496 RepID=UPI0010446726|nr:MULTISPECIES: hypothetical protein [unclassified Curtobacterium]TCL72482.1 hypothetical protein EDF23_11319 [Curtobacterium sp. PhB128]TCL90623.1 hypothetical protein EDF29_11398 [Curtobacterium sp. PhB138]